jgi:hypothetical protein
MKLGTLLILSASLTFILTSASPTAAAMVGPCYHPWSVTAEPAGVGYVAFGCKIACVGAAGTAVCQARGGQTNAQQSESIGVGTLA